MSLAVRAFVATVAVASVAASGSVVPAAAAVARPTYSGPVAVDAPQGKRGGIMTPFVACSNLRVEPRVRSAIESLKTGQTWTYRWRGAVPSYGFPRVAVGRYEVRTTGTCAGTTTRWTETVRVREKTAERTVSRAEWRRIKKGMTVDRVAAIVGYRGKFGGRYGGVATRSYDMMRFWSFSIVTFRKGHVVAKDWDVDHD